MTPPRPLLGLAGFAVAVTLVAVTGSLAAVSARSTYAALDLPAWAPPGWLFGPVWTVLYVLIAVSGWLVWRQAGWDRSLTVYAVQLVLNALWTPLFFGADRYGLALTRRSGRRADARSAAYRRDHDHPAPDLRPAGGHARLCRAARPPSVRGRQWPPQRPSLRRHRQ